MADGSRGAAAVEVLHLGGNLVDGVLELFHTVDWGLCSGIRLYHPDSLGYIVIVKEVTRTALPTPDGRCFYAYSEVPRRFRRKKITKTL